MNLLQLIEALQRGVKDYGSNPACVELPDGRLAVITEVVTQRAAEEGEPANVVIGVRPICKVVIRGKPWMHPVMAALEWMKVMSLHIDEASFIRVAGLIAATEKEFGGFCLTDFDDLRRLCERFGFVVAADSVGQIRAYLPGEWPAAMAEAAVKNA